MRKYEYIDFAWMWVPSNFNLVLNTKLIFTPNAVYDLSIIIG